MTKCLDTYILIEIHNGNPGFAHLLDEEIVITDLTFAEFYGNLLRKHNKKTADYWERKLSLCCRPVSKELLIQSVIFRVEHAKENLSFFDCVGYMFSRKNNFAFVTGDKAFKNREGVLFIPK